MAEPSTYNYPWLDEYLANKPHAVKEYKLEWECYRYLIAGKMFAMIGGDRDGIPIVTLKCDPLEGDTLRRQYPVDIIEGYYMNKVHWCSVYLEGKAPDGVLRHMVDSAYSLVLSSLSKKLQRELADEN